MKQLPLGAVIGLIAIAGQAHASVVDQSNPIFPSYASFTTPSGIDFQQQVTDGVTGTLAALELFTVGSGAADETVSIIANGKTINLGAVVLGGSTPPAYATGTIIDTSAKGISLTAGETFVIDIVGDGTGQLGGSTSSYSGGALTESVGGYSFAPVLSSLAFETYINPAPVPLPAGLPLLLSGLAAMGLIARRRGVFSI